MNYFNETIAMENANTDIMEILLMREQFCDFEDSLSNYFNDDRKASLSDVNYLNDCGFVNAVAQL